MAIILIFLYLIMQLYSVYINSIADKDSYSFIDKVIYFKWITLILDILFVALLVFNVIK